MVDPFSSKQMDFVCSPLQVILVCRYGFMVASTNWRHSREGCLPISEAIKNESVCSDLPNINMHVECRRNDTAKKSNKWPIYQLPVKRTNNLLKTINVYPIHARKFQVLKGEEIQGRTDKSRFLFKNNPILHSINFKKPFPQNPLIELFT